MVRVSNYIQSKIMQRISCIIICIALLAAFIPITPTGASAVSEPNEKYVVDLTLCKDLSKLHIDNNWYTSDLRYITLEDTTAAIASGGSDVMDCIPWGFAGYDPNIIPTGTAESEARSCFRNNQTYGAQLQIRYLNQWVSFKIHIPKAGSYYTFLTHARASYGGIGNVYLAPWSEDASTWRSASYLIGSVNFYNSTMVNENATELNTVNIAAEGDYVLTFLSAQKPGQGNNMYPRNFTLSVNPPSALNSVSVSLSKTSILSTGTAQASVTGIRVDGKNADLSSASVIYSSSNPDIASIDSGSGLITAHTFGNTQITASVTLDGITRESTTTLNVLSLQSIEVKDKKLLVGQHSQAVVTGVMSDGSMADLSNYQLCYSSLNPEVANIDMQTGEITANAVGDATITASLTYGGEEISATANVSVLESAIPVEVDFSQTTTSNNIITDSPGYTVNESESKQDTRRVYKMNGINVLHIYMGGRYWPADTTMSSRFTIKVNVPISSYYAMNMQGALWYCGCVTSIYVDDSYMGDYSFYNGDTTKTLSRTLGEVKRLNSLYLTEGEHNISFRSRSAYDTTPYLLLYKLYFNPVNSEPVLTGITSDIPAKLAIGENLHAGIKAMMTDGAPYHFGLTGAGVSDTENVINATNSDQSVAEMGSLESVKIGGGDIATAIITPKVIGNTIVNVSAQVHGVTITHDYPIEVTNEQLSQVQAHLSADEVFAGDTVQIIPVNTLDSGRVIDNNYVETTYASDYPGIAAIDGDKLVTSGIGTARINVTSILNGITVTNYFDVNILPEGMTKLEVTAGGSKYFKIDDTEGTPLLVKAIDNVGKEIDTKTAVITYQTLTPDLAAVNENGLVLPKAMGDAQFKVTVTINGRTRSITATLPIIKGKTEPTIYTMQKRANIKENGEKYDWANNEIKSYTDKADQYVSKADSLWNMVVSEGLPRSITVGQANDPDAYKCRYCGADLHIKFGEYPWIIDALSDPWKIQCPDCKRRFPSNDFGNYYKLGLNDYGAYDASQARQKNDALVAEGKDGYLKNIFYPEKGDGWGVDDGLGYLPGNVYSNGITERHTYIAYYLHWGIWYHNTGDNGILENALENLAYAYAYTGEAKYGRAGAILLDRIADFYPDYNLYQWRNITVNSDGGSGRGKTVGCIWECHLAIGFATAYDMLYPAYDDQYVIDFLNNKSTQYKMIHSKKTATQIRNNVEDGILRTTYSGVTDSSISGNFGMAQQVTATAAVVLNSMPETGEWIDWIMRNGVSGSVPCTGGNVAVQLVNGIDRDGMGNESSSYNVGWLKNLLRAADVLASYETYQNADLYQNAKFAKMFTAFIPLTLSSYYSPQIGDSGSTAGEGLWMTQEMAISGFRHLGDPKFAAIAYLLNNNSVNGLREDITVENPEQIQQDIQNVINEYGTLDLESDMMTGFGFEVLRGGAKYISVGLNGNYNNQRDFWIFFGKNSTAHAHKDTLNLGIDSYGLNMAPDLGYPEATGTQPNRLQWVSATLSHNTVMVNLENQNKISYHGMPLHFDDSGRVKVMDVDAKEAYPAADIYRRTVVMVEATDDVSYGVDFFRVSGGSDQIYSFHSQSDEVYETQGLNLVKQADENGNYIGTYAGADIPWGPDPLSATQQYNTQFPRGFTWLDKVNRDSNPGSSFAVDFKVKDFNSILPSIKNLHLRMTMINDVPMSEVAIVNGYPPIKPENNKIDNLKYVLVRHSGQNLDTLFTTVYEPYQDNRYIQSIQSVPTEIANGSQGAKDTIKAVKVTHTSGRVDYVIYATNNTVTYCINNVFNFRGFVGVYTALDGEPIYTYINDGDTIGTQTSGIAAVTGTVTDFTKELQTDNQITILPDQTISVDKLSGEYIYINNDGVQNGVYKIDSASLTDGGKINLSIGYVSPIRSYIDSSNLSGGYVYNIAAGQSFRIPLANVTDNSPVFTPVGKKHVDANSQISFQVSATSPINRPLTYQAVSLPRGASFDPATREFMWVPDSRQQGENHVSIEASDGYLSTTEHFIIEVLGGTSGGSGGGTLSVTQTTQTTQTTQLTQTEQTNTLSCEANFTDLANYSWAADAIKKLAEAGIINGTGKDTFSPEKKISRADFAVILVRAFKLTTNSNESFLDVDKEAYYAPELAAAKENGIIEGFGDKYNPTAPIIRQDLMVILERALNKAGYELQDADESTLSKFADTGETSDYAKQAIAKLIKNGLVLGTEDKINPKGCATRAEVAVLVSRVLNKQS